MRDMKTLEKMIAGLNGDERQGKINRILHDAKLQDEAWFGLVKGWDPFSNDDVVEIFNWLEYQDYVVGDVWEIILKMMHAVNVLENSIPVRIHDAVDEFLLFGIDPGKIALELGINDGEKVDDVFPIITKAHDLFNDIGNVEGQIWIKRITKGDRQ